MPKLVQKCGFIKGGGGAGYMKYIATREGVEKIHGRGKPTENQQRLIADLLSDFPDANELFEYEDYCANPCVSTASAFIAMAVDSNAHGMRKGDAYMRYISTRPRVEKRGDHGLFGREREVSLDAAMTEAREHTGNEWTIIFSLRREDAQRLGYDRAEQWRSLLLRHQGDIADAMKIPPDQLRWYAAFHDEGHHPHVHMMVWSIDPKQGYLTTTGIKTIRSRITGDIFQGELQTLYQKKDVSYKEVTTAAHQAMGELIRQMEGTLCDSPSIAKKMETLAQSLETVTGKKVYGYLTKPVKEQVDTIVDELAQLPEVAECYEKWNSLRDELEGYYKVKPRVHLPISQQKEFRSIKNLVIQEAENIRRGVVTFEDEALEISHEDEPVEIANEEPQETAYSNNKVRTVYQMASRYREAKAVLTDEEQPDELKREALHELEQLWDEGFTVAAHQLGKVWRDGLCDPKDAVQAERWFRLSAEAGNTYSQYALGKLLQGEDRVQEAVAWYQKAAAQENPYAQYRLGKLLISGKGVSKNIDQAIKYLTASAQAGNQYAQYALGKLYLIGQEVAQNRELAKAYLAASAAQGNPYAQIFLDHFDHYQNPSVWLCATKLLHQLSQIFRDNSVPPTNPSGIRIDSKRRKALMEKRLAMGHRPDDHEEYLQAPN